MTPLSSLVAWQRVQRQLKPLQGPIAEALLMLLNIEMPCCQRSHSGSSGQHGAGMLCDTGMLLCTFHLQKVLLPCVTKPQGGLEWSRAVPPAKGHKPWCVPAFMHISCSLSCSEGCETCWVGVWER